jgi:hypothetical protein
MFGFKVSKSANTGKIIFFKYSIWVSKSTEFHADLFRLENFSTFNSVFLIPKMLFCKKNIFLTY